MFDLLRQLTLACIDQDVLFIRWNFVVAILILINAKRKRDIIFSHIISCRQPSGTFQARSRLSLALFTLYIFSSWSLVMFVCAESCRILWLKPRTFADICKPWVLLVGTYFNLRRQSRIGVILAKLKLLLNYDFSSLLISGNMPSSTLYGFGWKAESLCICAESWLGLWLNHWSVSYSSIYSR